MISSRFSHSGIKSSCYSIILLFCFAAHNPAQAQFDSVQTIHTAVISENAQKRQARSSNPLQRFDSKTLSSLNVIQLSDAAKYFSGVSVKDYGGLGGLKTISIRSLGANHTAINYDGITINDAQTGQIDLGKFSLDNIEAISISTGQGNDIFQTARVVSSAGVLNIRTLTPQLDGKPYKIRPTLIVGSFGLVNTRILTDFRTGKKLTNSLNTEYMSSNGKYPFTLYYGNKKDSSSHEQRKNSDIKTFRAELSSFYNTGEQSKLRSKIFYYQSERGLPGAITFYNTADTRERLWDKTFFAQAHYDNYFNSKWAFQSNAKFNWTYQRYLNPDYLGGYGKTENNYYQWEYYLSSSLLYRLSSYFSMSYATDLTINHMNADLHNFAYPTRLTGLNALTAKYSDQRLIVVANALYSAWKEKVNYRDKNTPDKNGQSKSRVTPSVSLSYKLFEERDLYLRLHYKEIFRAPTFNDLYYTEIGNPSLNPEYATQYNLGSTWTTKAGALVPSLALSLDAYYNKVKDKIMSRPSSNIFKWTTENIGKVDIYGIDAAIETHLQAHSKCQLILSAAYTFQRAWDVTSQNDPVDGLHYKHQIPYTPTHSGSGRLVAETPWLTMSYGIVYSGGRYTLGENIPENFLEGYTDQSISLTKKMQSFGKPTSLSIEVLNLTNTQYEVIRNFPMPGRHFRLTANINL